MEMHGSDEPVCAFCDSKRLGLVMDFGEVGLAGAFLRPEQFAAERTFPMRLQFCRDCYAVQVTDKVPADVMFKEGYFYFSSSIGTLRDHFREYASELTKRFLDPSRATALEFGCNDGVLLRPLADQGIRTVIGVDPATKSFDVVYPRQGGQRLLHRRRCPLGLRLRRTTARSTVIMEKFFDGLISPTSRAPRARSPRRWLRTARSPSRFTTSAR